MPAKSVQTRAPADVEITTTDGATFRRRVDHPRGHVLNPMTDAEIEAKFRGMAERSMSERQMTEVLQTHQNASRGQARQAAIKMLDQLRIADPLRCLQSYPHQFSGGMRQRIMIAMALLSQPDVLIADEPTTALDVTVQAQIVALLRQLQQDHGTSIIMVTHDLGLVAGLSDQVMVMYGGRVMEHALANDIFYNTRHPYTRALLESVPRLEHADDELVAIPGLPPSLRNMPAGCPFAPRCSAVDSNCQNPAPLTQVAKSHLLACHHAGAQP